LHSSGDSCSSHGRRGSFSLYSLSPLIFLVLAVALAKVTDAGLPPWSDFAIYSGVPPLGLLPVLLLVLLFNGFGEETGWRGFALAPLQHRYGPVAGTLILAALWAGWHTPAFFVVETYRNMSVPVIIGGFGLGICAGAIVLSRVAQRTRGSILAPALWHATYNMTSATAASRRSHDNLRYGLGDGPVDRRGAAPNPPVDSPCREFSLIREGRPELESEP